MASMSHIRHYRVLPWATGPLTLLESIAKVPDQQVAKMGKSSIFWLLSFLRHDSTIMAEAITMIQTQTSNINHWVLHSLLITWTILQWFSSTPVLMLSATWPPLPPFSSLTIPKEQYKKSNRNKSQKVFWMQMMNGMVWKCCGVIPI